MVSMMLSITPWPTSPALWVTFPRSNVNLPYVVKLPNKGLSAEIAGWHLPESLVNEYMSVMGHLQFSHVDIFKKMEARNDDSMDLY